MIPSSIERKVLLKKMSKDETTGILAIFTGDGKGKTTAAIGTAVRAIGYGHKVIMLQFMKGDWYYGELDGLKRLQPEFELEVFGIGFYKIMGDDKPEAEHRAAAYNGLKRAKEIIVSGEYNLLILDEINNVIKVGLLQLDDVIEVLKERNKSMHVILTGRDAHARLIEMADLVSEVKNIKHPFSSGIKAQKGFDF